MLIGSSKCLGAGLEKHNYPHFGVEGAGSGNTRHEGRNTAFLAVLFNCWNGAVYWSSTESNHSNILNHLQPSIFLLGVP